MSDIFLFALLGAGTGALYALSALGIVLTYRASNVVNFASGAMGMLGTFAFWELREQQAWPFVPALIVGVALGALLGYLTHALLMRPLRHASTLTRIVATLVALVFIQGAARLHYSPDQTYVVNDFLPVKPVDLLGITVGSDRLWLIAIAIVVTAVIWAVYRYSRFGLATSAAAENPAALATMGWPSDRIASVNWAVGGALAGLAGILLSPIAGLTVDNATNLLIPTLAAALIGNLRSFPLTLAGGMGIGILQAEATRFVDVPGIGSAVPFLAIIAVVVIRGRRLPLRSEANELLPRVSAGRIHWRVLVPVVVVTALLLQFALPVEWVLAITVTMIAAILLLSVVLVTGFAGQVSLAQWAIAGLGALVTCKLVVAGWPFELAIIAGMLAGLPIGFIVGLPALRARGISLAIATLGLALCVDAIVFTGTSIANGELGLQIGLVEIFGLDISSTTRPRLYGLFVLLLLVGVGLMLANFRRGTSGRRMLAMRANERAAAALGIDVMSAKLVAFAFGAVIACLAGILVMLQFPTAVFNEAFKPFKSIEIIQHAVLGGVGYLSGPVLGAQGEPGGVVARALASISPGAEKYGPVIFSGLTLLVILRAPSGFVQLTIDDARLVSGWVRGLLRRGPKPVKPAAVAAPILVEEGDARGKRTDVLEVDGIGVQFGSVSAVGDVSFTLRSGEVLGVIGPNGAGKTTLIDAITGFVPLHGGALRLNGVDIRSRSVRDRARLGIGRSFQSLELFEDMTVAENLLAASDRGGWGTWVTDLVRPRTARFTKGAAFAIEEFGIADSLGQLPSELSYGGRRLLAIVRTIAMGPGVILLDEPAAGLDQQEREELAKVIRRLADDWGMAVLLIEHDVQLVASVSDRMLALDFGRRVVLDVPDVVREHPKVVESYLGGAVTEQPATEIEA